MVTELRAQGYTTMPLERLDGARAWRGRLEVSAHVGDPPAAPLKSVPVIRRIVRASRSPIFRPASTTSSRSASQTRWCGWRVPRGQWWSPIPAEGVPLTLLPEPGPGRGL